MALIKCPECGKEISDKSKQCIYCGYPIEEYIQEQSNQLFDVTLNSLNLDNLNNKKDKENQTNVLFKQIMNYMNKHCNQKNFSLLDLMDMSVKIRETPCIIGKELNKEKAAKLVDYLVSLNCSAEMTISTDISPKTNNSNDKLICPRCGSSAVTTGQRGYSLLTGFLGSNKTVNRCGKCGYSWQPK